MVSVHSKPTIHPLQHKPTPLRPHQSRPCSGARLTRFTPVSRSGLQTKRPFSQDHVDKGFEQRHLLHWPAGHVLSPRRAKRAPHGEAAPASWGGTGGQVEEWVKSGEAWATLIQLVLAGFETLCSVSPINAIIPAKDPKPCLREHNNESHKDTHHVQQAPV